jgi:Mn2+/Fe2+ NRAMP family transporter
VSLLTTYPFVFDAGRRSVISAFQASSISENPKRIKQVWWYCTLILIPIFTVIAIFADSLGLVIGINGSLCGITIGFTIPGLIMWCRARMMDGTRKTRRSKWIGGFLIVFGIFMTILGMVSLFIHF